MRLRDRQTGRRTGRQAERERGRERERGTERERERERKRETDRQTGCVDTQTDRLCRQTGGQTCRQADTGTKVALWDQFERNTHSLCPNGLSVCHLSQGPYPHCVSCILMMGIHLSISAPLSPSLSLSLSLTVYHSSVFHFLA